MYHYLLRTLPRPLLINISVRMRSLIDVLLQGNRFTDPINGRSYRWFLPYGQTEKSRRKHALAPGTLSLERHRLMWLYLKEQTDFFSKPLRVLHIAPEQCFYKRFRKLNNLEYITADYNSPIADVHFDLHQSPFPDNNFDIILCNHVLEHVDNDRKCMQELYRMLKPGGWALLQVPIDHQRQTTLEEEQYNTDALREEYYWQKDHVRLYGLDYPKRLQEVGFNVEENDLAQKLPQHLAERYRIDRAETLYIARK